MTAMSNSAAPEEGSATSRQVRKARMLVSMLGAEFAKSAEHPFFRDLAQTAIRPVSESRLTQPEMSRALEKLVKHLADPRKPRNVQKTNESENRQQPEPEPEQDRDIFHQHPVLIAKHLLKLSPEERIEVMRSLPGRTARLVAFYTNELNKNG